MAVIFSITVSYVFCFRSWKSLSFFPFCRYRLTLDKLHCNIRLWLRGLHFKGSQFCVIVRLSSGTLTVELGPLGLPVSDMWGFAGVPFLLSCIELHGNEGNRSYLTPRHCWSLLCLLSMQTTVRLNNVLHCVCLNSKFTWLTFFLKSIGIHFLFRIQYLEFDKMY